MAIVINPDGTVSTIETTHDQYGNLKPKIDSELMKEQEIHYNNNTLSEPKHKEGYVYPTSSASGESKRENRSSNAPSRRQLFITTKQIDNFFSKILSKGKWLGNSAYIRLKSKLSAELQIYFASKYKKYIEQIKAMEEARMRTSFKKPKDKKKKNKKKSSHQVKNFGTHNNSHAGFTPEENYASSQDFEVRTSNPQRPARAPKYAYARDRFGRVQERDSFNEEKRNEFFTAQNRQKNYDYSSYDSNDDHEGAYSEWE